MALVLLVPLALLAALVTVVATALTPRGATTGTDVETSPDAFRRARRHAAVVGWASWAAFLLAGFLLPDLLWSAFDDGILMACTPAVAGLAALLVAAVGERTWPRPAAPVRRAALVRRTVRDVAPPRLLVLTLAWAGALLAVLATTALSADPSGRTVTIPAGTTASSSAGPYPGAPYGLPVTLGTVALLAATWAVVHLVAARPTVAAVSTADDARLRRAGAQRVLACTQLVLGWTLGGVLLITGGALQRAATTMWSVDGVDRTATDGLALGLGVAALLAGAVVLLTATGVSGGALVRASRSTTPAPAAPAAA